MYVLWTTLAEAVSSSYSLYLSLFFFLSLSLPSLSLSLSLAAIYLSIHAIIQSIYLSISPRFKSLIKKSLFILIVYSWSLADEVTWPNIWAEVPYIIKTKTNLEKARHIQSSLNHGGDQHSCFRGKERKERTKVLGGIGGKELEAREGKLRGQCIWDGQRRYKENHSQHTQGISEQVLKIQIGWLVFEIYSKITKVAYITVSPWWI